MKERQRAIIEALKEHHKSLYGNGRPGLDDRMTEAESFIVDAKKKSSELTTIRNQLLIAVVSAVIAAWIIGATIGCTRVSFSETRTDGTKVKGAYTYILQDKNLDLGYDPTSGIGIKANNSSDPAVEAFKEGLAAGVKGVAP